MSSRPNNRQSKSVTFMYGGLAGILLVVIATVALVVQPPSPPALAEFAPQAEKTIEEAPDEQSSQFGKDGSGDCAAGQQDCSEGGEGAGLGGGGTPKPTTPPPPPPEEDDARTVIDAKRVRRCVGDPPRQTEDPQSPPCVNYFEGDNGGATSPGVTRDEIRVVVNQGTNTLPFDDLKQLAEFFNRRYELYGRKLHLMRGKDLHAGLKRVESQRLAADAAAEAKAFAAIGYGPRNQILDYRTRLAQHKIVSVSARDDFTSEAALQALHPYAWNYTLSYDRIGRDLADFACKSLVDHLAEYGGPGVRGTVRSFAVVRGIDEAADQELQGDSRPLVDGLRACRAPVVVRDFRYGGDTQETELRQLLTQLQADGVTTVIPVEQNSGSQLHLLRAASSIGYQPEWLLPGGGDARQLEDGSFYGQLPPEQTAHLFALGGWNKGNPTPDRPSIWAYQEMELPPPPTGYASMEMEWNYEGLLLLASGIQAAGPRLTPETFAKGLQGLKFPNPGAGAAPYYQASVGFAGDHTMVDDEALQWWRASTPAYRSATGEAGGWCYIDLGARWRAGQWPKRTYPFFDVTGQCR